MTDDKENEGKDGGELCSRQFEAETYGYHERRPKAQ